ncbi:MAG TPA: molybdopterin-dependent oxidoreductase [Gemmatimonadaceae bacterium]|jgi:DMSO/TMAO reductase YedYZ molybdopterin-dependent catalytic subunit
MRVTSSVSRLVGAIGLSLVAAVASVAPLRAQQATPSISVSGAVTQPLTLTATDLGAMPRASVTTNSNGIATTYEGVWLADVLKKAGVPFGAGMRGPALATYVIASASDGYQVVFSLGELDPDMTDGQYLLADKADGKPLFGENGSFRLVIPKDKRGARSIRMLTSLTVVQTRK